MTRALQICAALSLCAPSAAMAAEGRLKPFILVSRGPGELEKAVEGVRGKLAAAGFEVAGSYSPYPGAVILAVTSEALRAAASQHPLGGYAAAQRVTATQVGGEVQIAYTNPVYMAHAYRLKADLAPVADRLAAALGPGEAYGSADGLSPRQLRGYHYMVGMEYFDDPTRLGTFASHAEAVQAVEAGLAASRGGARRVYKVDLPASGETVYGVALADGCSGDGLIMKEIDAGPVRSTGHLPYEILISGQEAWALYARFRIAINFTDLKMMGDHSFMNIRCAPDAIEKALKQVVGKG
jgi:hypothetical protein